MKKFTISIIATIFILTNNFYYSIAQNPSEIEYKRCLSGEIWQKQMEKPEFARKNQINEAIIREYSPKLMPMIQKLSNSTSEKTAITKYKIPVVVHVIHEGGEENITDQQIRSQISVLNEDFQKRQSSKSIGVGGANASVEFFLAKFAPNGDSTKGITRHYSYNTTHSASNTDEIKYFRLLEWDRNRYLNIWVVKSIDKTVLGYCPGGTMSSEIDGLVVRARNFGKVGNISPPYHYGTTATHEIGHWLGLMHTFSGCCLEKDDCNSCGDLVCDTPNSSTEVHGCPENEINSCLDWPLDIPDIKFNYMSYFHDNCMNNFTEGQVGRMWSVLDNFRTYIWSEENLKSTGYYQIINSKEELISSIKFHLQPNPASEFLYFYLENEVMESNLGSIEITDMLGKVLKEINLKQRVENINNSTSQSNDEISISVSDLSNGIYLAKVKTTNGNWVQKWIKN